MSHRRILVVMAGGSGERFWPMSTPARPKQLLNLTHDEKTMLEEAVDRVAPTAWEGNVWISTSQTLGSQIAEAGTVPTERVIAEPGRRNTLGALAWVAANLMARGLDDATVGVVTADHRISDGEAFSRAVTTALDVAETEGGLVTIGIVPDRPETGYGYIQIDAGAPPIVKPTGQAFRSSGFREKPNLELAEQYVASGDYLWNGGMFFYTLDLFLSEFDRISPEIAHAIRDMAEAIQAGDHEEAARRFFDLPNISIDFALAEHVRRLFVVPAEFPWDDVGSWDSMHRSFDGDHSGNVLRGRTVVIDSRNSIVVNEGMPMTIGVVGMDGVVVVATKDGILVCPVDQAQRVKEIVTQMKAHGH